MGLDRRPAIASAAIRCNTQDESGQKRRGCRAVRSRTSPRRSPLRRTAARDMLISVDDPVTGPLELAGNPMKLSSFADPPIRQPAPDLDADRDRIPANSAFEAGPIPLRPLKPLLPSRCGGPACTAAASPPWSLPVYTASFSPAKAVLCPPCSMVWGSRWPKYSIRAPTIPVHPV
jgi:hypothetical protein